MAPLYLAKLATSPTAARVLQGGQVKSQLFVKLPFPGKQSGGLGPTQTKPNQNPGIRQPPQPTGSNDSATLSGLPFHAKRIAPPTHRRGRRDQ